MANSSLTIEQVKDLKSTLDETIFDLVREFEEETGVRVSYLSLEREEDRIPYSDTEYEKLPLRGVKSNTNIDIL